VGWLAPRESLHHAATWFGLRPASARETVSRRSCAAVPGRAMGLRLSGGLFLAHSVPLL